jgi:hypothetical protein
MKLLLKSLGLRDRHRFVNQTLQSAGKKTPFIGLITQRHSLEFTQQMNHAALFGQGADFVVGAEKVDNENGMPRNERRGLTGSQGSPSTV